VSCARMLLPITLPPSPHLPPSQHSVFCALSCTQKVFSIDGICSLSKERATYPHLPALLTTHTDRQTDRQTPVDLRAQAYAYCAHPITHTFAGELSIYPVETNLEGELGQYPEEPNLLTGYLAMYPEEANLLEGELGQYPVDTNLEGSAVSLSSLSVSLLVSELVCCVYVIQLCVCCCMCISVVWTCICCALVLFGLCCC